MEAVKRYIETVDVKCVPLCLKQVGATQKDREDRTCTKLISWINACSIDQTLTSKTLNQLKAIAIERFGEDVKTPSSG